MNDLKLVQGRRAALAVVSVFLVAPAAALYIIQISYSARRGRVSEWGLSSNCPPPKGRREREKVNLSTAFKSEFLRVGPIVKGNKVPVQPRFSLVTQNGKV